MSCSCRPCPGPAALRVPGGSGGCIGAGWLHTQCCTTRHHVSRGFADLTDGFQELFLVLLFAGTLGVLLRKSCRWQMRRGGLWSLDSTQPPGTGTTGEGWGARRQGRLPAVGPHAPGRSTCPLPLLSKGWASMQAAHPPPPWESLRFGGTPSAVQLLGGAPPPAWSRAPCGLAHSLPAAVGGAGGSASRRRQDTEDQVAASRMRLPLARPFSGEPRAAGSVPL